MVEKSFQTNCYLTRITKMLTRILRKPLKQKKFLETEGDLPFLEFIEIEPILERIKILSLLNGEELLRVSSFLSTISEIKEIGNAYKEDYPIIFSYTSRLSNFKDIVISINKAVGPDGRIVDDASPLLAIIRREMKITYMRIQTILQEIIYSKENEEAIQDTIITKEMEDM